MTSSQKILSILDIFTEDHSTIFLNEIIEELKVSAPTGYRYVKELCDSGLLARVGNGGFIIGPKIIKLDRQIRMSDPIINKGKFIMKELVDATGCQVLLSNIYNDEILNVHSETPSDIVTSLTYTRGKPHPITKGATSRIVIANLPRNLLAKIYEDYKEEISKEGLGENWKDFNSSMGKLRKQGYCITHGELDKDVTGIAAPIFQDDQVIGSLTLVLSTRRFEVFNIEKLIELISQSAKKISCIERQEALTVESSPLKLKK